MGSTMLRAIFFSPISRWLFSWLSQKPGCSSSASISFSLSACLA
jgi:hypothetical protein